VRAGEFDEELEDIPLSIRALVATVAGDEFLAHLEQLLARVGDTESEPDPADDDGGSNAAEDDEA
jgi:hypothetical protein